MIFIVLFFVLPLIEIALFVEIGGWMGVTNTLLLCVVTAILGGFLFRRQGLEKLVQFQAGVDEGRLPVQELFDGVCILVAGALLMTPGFATDAFGFSLFIPAVRRFVARQLAKRKNLSFHAYGGEDMRGARFSYNSRRDYGQAYPRSGRGSGPDPDTIDVTPEHVDDDVSPKHIDEDKT